MCMSLRAGVVCLSHSCTSRTPLRRVPVLRVCLRLAHRASCARQRDGGGGAVDRRPRVRVDCVLHRPLDVHGLSRHHLYACWRHRARAGLTLRASPCADIFIHFVGTILNALFIIEGWHYVYLWYLFGFTMYARARARPLPTAHPRRPYARITQPAAGADGAHARHHRRVLQGQGELSTRRRESPTSLHPVRLAHVCLLRAHARVRSCARACACVCAPNQPHWSALRIASHRICE